MTESQVSPGTVFKYHNRQGSDIIAALDTEGIWHVLCIASAGHIHQFKWTDEELEFDRGDAPVEIAEPAKEDDTTGPEDKKSSGCVTDDCCADLGFTSRASSDDKLRLIRDTVEGQTPFGTELSDFQRRLRLILDLS